MLVKEVVKHFVHDPEGVYVDGTAGTGGHSAAILERLAGRGCLISLDRDPDAVRLSKKRLATSGDNIWVINANFADLDVITCSTSWSGRIVFPNNPWLGLQVHFFAVSPEIDSMLGFVVYF